MGVTLSPAARAENARARAKMNAQKKSLPKLIKKIARSQALSVLETKYVTSRFAALTFNSKINTGFLEMYPLIPSVAQGSGTYQRLDNTLQPLSIRTNWHIALSTASRSMNVRVVLYCLQHKSIKYFPDLAAITSGPDMLKSGDATLTQGYDGVTTDEDLKINNDEYTLLKCFKFNLMSNVGAANGDTVAGNSPNTLPSFKNLSYTYPVKSQLKYDPAVTGQDWPQGHAPFWVLGYSHTDGTGPDIAFKDISVSAITSMTYKDA